MSEDPKNPFSAPTPSNAPVLPNHEHGHNHNHGQRQPGLGYVRQIPILAIITIVQGALLLLAAFGCAAYGMFFAYMPTMMPEAERARMQAEAGPMFEIIGAVAIGLAVLVLVISLLHFIAGFRALKYRGRSFIMVTWFLGLFGSFTMYCAPTSIGLGIWGLIVFFNPATKSAFKMVENGMDKREVERQFY